ncbi:transporter substrate-binding domain-containing protein [Maricaulis parjimensis]|uniref:transporter substrate-binding domain-containing protein n=1 Tax=Maricaulis parjimensis TaxID=144023 RepID=UPI00193A5C9A|nr:transporter substrate-binding domain-containing protein [Maricaulis parjimensis]
MMRLPGLFPLSLMALLASLSLTAPALPQTDTLASVRERGHLRCGINPFQQGMAVEDGGRWLGMGPDLCRAFAAATLGDPNAVIYIPVTARTRFPALQSGEIDVLVRTTTWTFTRDTSLGADFIGPFYVEQERILVRRDTGLTEFEQLDGQRICTIAGSLTESVMQNREQATGIDIETVPVGDTIEYRAAYEAGRCIGVTDGQAGLTALRALMDDPDAHVFINGNMAISPLSIAVRHGDDHWEDIIRWTFNALASAEELGITQTNVQRLSTQSRHPIIYRLINAEGGSGDSLGLDTDWAFRAIQAVGNLGEIYERAFGEGSDLVIPRGPSALWRDGGMIVTPPFE